MIAGDPVQRPVAHLEPRRARQPQSREPDGTEGVVSETITRDHRDAKRARTTQHRTSERIVRRAERNPEQNPADFFAWNTRLTGKLRRGATLPLSRELRRVGEIHDVALPLFLIALRGREIEHVVGVDVFLVEAIVGDGAIGPGVSKDLPDAVSALARSRETKLGHSRWLTGNRVVHGDESVHDIARQPLVVGGDVERARERISLAVELIQSLNRFAVIGRVPRSRVAPARTNIVSGPNVTEFSEMSPKSKTSVGFAAVLTMGICAQNSRFSAREMSAPLELSTVRTDRQRRPAG